MMSQMTVEGGRRTPHGGTMLVRSEIIEGDCVSGMRQTLEPSSVNVIVTSPPYNIGKAYKRHDDDQKPDAYLDWMGAVATACERVLAPDGSFFLNLGGKPSDPGWPFKVVDRFLGKGLFRLQNTILWVKSIVIDDDLGGGEATIRGHYKPVNSRRFLSGMAEYVFHLTKSGNVPLAKLRVGTPYKDKSNVERWRDEATDLRDRGNVWFIPYETIHSERPHPCVFPPKLPRMCILLHGIEKTNLVLDPFAGTGSTGVACATLGVPFVGFDIDPYYVTLAKSNLKEAITEAAELARSEKQRGA
jgi:site-specific DNA-methyltransferase (adenine-specific)